MRRKLRLVGAIAILLILALVLRALAARQPHHTRGDGAAVTEISPSNQESPSTGIPVFEEPSGNGSTPSQVNTSRPKGERLSSEKAVCRDFGQESTKCYSRTSMIKTKKQNSNVRDKGVFDSASANGEDKSNQLGNLEPNHSTTSDIGSSVSDTRNGHSSIGGTDQENGFSKQDVVVKPSQQASDQQDATYHEALKYEKHKGFWGRLNPFARKKYVNRQLDPIRSRVNELDELTAKNSKMIADVDSRAAEGIRQAMNKANDADSHALDAVNRANHAQQTAQQATTKIGNMEQAVTKIDQYQPVTQAEIRFRPGQAVLSKKAKEALDEMATALKNQRGYIIEIQGFSDGRGAAATQNSRQMAESVVHYLVLNNNIPVYRIYTVGMGNAPLEVGGRKANTRGGRVEISLLKNGLGDVGSSAAANASGSIGEVSGAATNGSNNELESQQPQGNANVTTERPCQSAPSKPPQL